MDLLDDLREEAGNQKAARREGLLGAERRHAQALLLARLLAPIKQSETPPAQEKDQTTPSGSTIFPTA
jgi:hypothetical protein